MSDDFDIAPPPEPSSKTKAPKKKGFLGKLFGAKNKSSPEDILAEMDASLENDKKPSVNDVDEIRSRLGLDKPARSVDHLQEELNAQKEATSTEESEQYDKEQAELNTTSENEESVPKVPVSSEPTPETPEPASESLLTEQVPLLDDTKPADLPEEETTPEPAKEFDNQETEEESNEEPKDLPNEQLGDDMFNELSGEPTSEDSDDKDTSNSSLEGYNAPVPDDRDEESSSSFAQDTPLDEGPAEIPDKIEVPEPSEETLVDKPEELIEPIDANEEAESTEPISDDEITKDLEDLQSIVGDEDEPTKESDVNDEIPSFVDDTPAEKEEKKPKAKKSKVATPKNEKLSDDEKEQAEKANKKEQKVKEVQDRIKKKEQDLEKLEKELLKQQKELEKQKKVVERKEKKFVGLKDEEQLIVKQVATVEKKSEANQKLFEKLSKQSEKLAGKEKKISTEESDLKKQEFFLNNQEKKVTAELTDVEKTQKEYERKLLKLNNQIVTYKEDAKEFRKKKSDFSSFKDHQEELIVKAKEELNKTRDSLYDRLYGFEETVHEREEELDLRAHSFAEWSPRTELETKEQKNLRLKQGVVLRRLAENEALMKKLSASPQLLDDPDQTSMVTNQYTTDLPGLLQHAHDLIAKDDVTQAKLKYNELREKFLTSDLSEFQRKTYSRKLKDLYEEIHVRLLEEQARETLK